MAITDYENLIIFPYKRMFEKSFFFLLVLGKMNFFTCSVQGKKVSKTYEK